MQPSGKGDFLKAKIADKGEPPAKPHKLRLYVAGTTPRSLRAVQNIKRICERELHGQYQLEVVDIYKEPARAAEDQIVAIPTLIKRAPGAVRRLIGDLSELAAVRRGLELHGRTS
jgi:circadian clock protein KaiB